MRLSFRRLCIAFVAIALFTFSFTSVKAQSDPISRPDSIDLRSKLLNLRDELVLKQYQLPSLLSSSAPSEKFQALQDELNSKRIILGEEIVSSVRRSTSSQSVIAIFQARVDMVIQEINTIEQLIGDPQTGEFTNRWNVLEQNTLEEIKQIGQEQMKLLKTKKGELARSTVPPELLLREAELEGWLSRVEEEIFKRKGTGQSKLIQVKNGLSLEEVHSTQTVLHDFEGDAGNRILKKQLRLQIELRSQQVIDPGLASLKNDLNADVEVYRLENNKLASRERGPPSQWDNPAKQVREAIRESAFLELEAFKQGDKVAFAEASANKKGLQRWMSRAVYGTNAPLSEFAFLSNADQLTLRNGYVAFQKEILKSPSSTDALLLADTKSRVQALTTQLEQTSEIRFAPDGSTSSYSPRPPPPEAGAGVVERSKGPISPISFQIETSLAAENIKISQAVQDPDFRQFDQNIWQKIDRLELVEQQKILDQSSTIVDGELLRQNQQLKKNLLASKGSSQNSGLNSFNKLQNQMIQGEASAVETLREADNNIQTSQSRRAVAMYSQPENLIEEPAKPFSQKQVIEQSAGTYPQEFDRFFPPDAERSRSHSRLIQNVQTAPGGIIIDFKDIDWSDGPQIEELHFDFLSSSLHVFANGRWLEWQHGLSPTALRQAYAFAVDGRVVAVDLRAPSIAELRWMMNNDVLDRRTSPEELKYALTTVNLHPVLSDTRIGEVMILADQIMFDILPLEGSATQNNSEFNGITLSGLRRALQEDRFNLILSGNSNRYRIMKSIISITNAKIESDSSLVVESKLDFALYQKSGEDYMPMQESSNWFSARQHELAAGFPLLDDLNAFASVAGLFQWLFTTEIPHNLSELIFLETEDFITPEVLFKGDTNE